jgi:ubiquinone/menaquinone biosynthesis C-methylase UbiE
VTRANAVFELGVGAWAYDVLTGQSMWRDQIGRLLDHAPQLEAADRILDLGCGPGVSTFTLAERVDPGVNLRGIDFASTMITRAKEHHAARFPGLENVSFEVADARALPYADNTFHLATGHSFLYLVGDRSAVLGEIFRVLEPGGRLVLMEPARSGSLIRAALRGLRQPGAVLREPAGALRFAISMCLWRVFSRVAGRLTPEKVRALFGPAGFVNVQCHPTLAGLGLHVVAEKPFP